MIDGHKGSKHIGSSDFRLATGQQATKNNKINYEVIQVAKETDKQENIVETWLSIRKSQKKTKKRK